MAALTDTRARVVDEETSRIPSIPIEGGDPRHAVEGVKDRALSLPKEESYTQKFMHKLLLALSAWPT
jgi:hypothetical protein